MDQDWVGTGQAVRARRQELGLSQQAVANGLADHGVAVDKSMVSRWEAGEPISHPAQVFALEAVLELEGGTLSRLVGFLPVTAVDAITIEDAISADTELSREAKRTLRAVLRALRMEA